MRLEAVIVAAALLAAGLAGCLGDEANSPEDREAVEPAASDQVLNVTAPVNVTEDDQGNGSTLGVGVPQVVVAHIDTGVNPYHEAFRDRSELANVHPSVYIDGYPADVPALNLTLNASSWEAGVQADAQVWDSVQEGQLYWIPGTRIVGAISFGPGGTNDQVDEETRILDDHGHGTMTGSRSTGDGSSLAPEARLVTIEGLGAESVRWAAEQGWIDVQTNSWLTFVPAPFNRAPVADTSEAFAFAAERMVTLAASGNGAGFIAGFAPTPTYLLSTGPPGVLLVGGHDNGKVTPWAGDPPHVVADAFRGLAATRDSLDEVSAHGFSCCTSAAAPYAAGGAASIVLEARTVLGDDAEGITDGVVARGQAGLVPDGPLADGVFNLSELQEVLLSTAQPRPTATAHDGDVHWTGEPGDQPEDPTSPGENAYCPGCWTAPVPWSMVPEEVPAHALVGYGGINEHSDEIATAVLQGAVAIPDRAEADRFFMLDQAVREQLYPEAPGDLSRVR